MHTKVDHLNVAKWECAKCEHIEESARKLYRHNELYHQEGQFKCSKVGCKFKSITRKPVIEHYELKHLSRDSFGNWREDDHLERALTLSATCLKCGAMFTSKVALHQHALVQHGIVLHQCFHAQCIQVSFIDLKDLRGHLKISHNDIDTWECPLCSEQFEEHHGLSEHIYESHAASV